MELHNYYPIIRKVFLRCIKEKESFSKVNIRYIVKESPSSSSTVDKNILTFIVSFKDKGRKKRVFSFSTFFDKDVSQKDTRNIGKILKNYLLTL